MQFNPVRGADLPPEEIREQAQLPNHGQLNALIGRLPEPVSTAVWLSAVACVRPEELAFQWKDLDAEKRMLWIVRAVNRGKLHTPKYHRANRPIRLTEADVIRLLTLKQLKRAKDEDWMFPNHRKSGPLRHEDLLGRVNTNPYYSVMMEIWRSARRSTSELSRSCRVSVATSAFRT